MNITKLQVIIELEKQEIEHRNKYKKIKLAECFPETIGYYFGKIFKASLNSSTFQEGKIYVKHVQIKDTIKSLLHYVFI